MTEDLGARQFTFGVITDTHLNQGEDDCNSPFEVNRLANARMRHVVRELNGQDLAFVINVGDLIHPVPAVPDLYERAAARFHEQVAELRHDLYLTPGNHDIGDKPNDWAPAAGICEDFVALWDKHFGAHYQSFDHAGMHFVIVNAQIINSGLACETEQQRWLEADLAANRDKRIFMASHYPPYFSRADEEENYDNIGEPGRSWLLGLLESHGVEALFIGHVHNFWYNRYADTDCYLLPSTSFVRQDYSEMYRAAPDPDAEAGRNDKPKLGYFLVHVHEAGHVVEIVRTYGRIDLPVYLSRLRSIDELRIEAGHYYHVINQGFLAEDREQMEGLLARSELRDAVAGFVFRLTADREPWPAVHEAADLAEALGVQASVHLRMCWSNPAEAWEDDGWVANRLPEAILAAATRRNVAVYADTFIDNDRGYFVRNGVLDRLNNPRQAFHVVRHLNGLLADVRELAAEGDVTVLGGRAVQVCADGRPFVLLLPDAGAEEVEFPEGFPGSELGRCVGLQSGLMEPAALQSAGTGYRLALPAAPGPLILMT